MSETEHTEKLLYGVHMNHRWKVVLVNNRHFCGYVQTNLSPKFNYGDLSWLVDVNGGLTYGPDEDGWLGFDCAHSWDECIHNGEVISSSVGKAERSWTSEDVATECRALAKQISRLTAVLETFDAHGWRDQQ